MTTLGLHQVLKPKIVINSIYRAAFYRLRNFSSKKNDFFEYLSNEFTDLNEIWTEDWHPNSEHEIFFEKSDLNFKGHLNESMEILKILTECIPSLSVSLINGY